jgi:hypothetical protein
MSRTQKQISENGLMLRKLNWLSIRRDQLLIEQMYTLRRRSVI